MYSTYMQGGMKSVISADDSSKPNDSKTAHFVPDTPLSFRAMILESLELGIICTILAMYKYKSQKKNIKKKNDRHS